MVIEADDVSGYASPKPEIAAPSSNLSTDQQQAQSNNGVCELYFLSTYIMTIATCL